MQNPAINTNPLNNFMRQPKLYIQLPSGGKYWSTGSLDLPENGQLPVYSMTAKDELLLKVPDALMSGQGIVDVIQHCVPHIKNAWSIPNIDLDVILIAIRIATYGELMKVPVKIKEEEFEYQVDLRFILAELTENIKWVETVQITPELVVYVKPFDYKTMSASATQTFETQRFIQIAADSSRPDAEKAQMFAEAFDKLNNITVGLINNAVFRVDSSAGSTDNLVFVREFMNNIDKSVFDCIKTHVETLRNANTVKPLVIAATPEMIAAGCTEPSVTVPLVFDPSTFFA